MPTKFIFSTFQFIFLSFKTLLFVSTKQTLPCNLASKFTAFSLNGQQLYCFSTKFYSNVTCYCYYGQNVRRNLPLKNYSICLNYDPEKKTILSPRSLQKQITSSFYKVRKYLNLRIQCWRKFKRGSNSVLFTIVILVMA